MRKTLLLTAFIACTFAGNAQIEKGKWIAGLGFEFGTNNFKSSQTNRDQKTNSSDVSIYIGNMISKEVLLGTGFSYSRDFSNSIYASDNYYKSIAKNYIFNFYTQWFKNIDKNFYYTPRLFLEMQNGNSTFLNKAPDFLEVKNMSSSKVYSVYINPVQGSYIIKNKFLLQAGFGRLGYSHTKTKSDVPGGDTDGSGSGFNVNFSPSISNVGISFIF